ncbi:hypothetical protein ARMGADRAFT_1014824 [Armillaria gallica]|uniref:Uncharacterized protein n=1 Tax=Armillaria gallica TaxID=47427 RepID=A0A2H3DS04_ARMGA|nr:hypothetical protein ARMGADRAFT_1014824 [Armillaria gallica]
MNTYNRHQNTLSALSKGQRPSWHCTIGGHLPSSSSAEFIDSLESIPGTPASSIVSASDTDHRSFRERRGMTFFISFTRPIFGPVTPAKDHLELRTGFLPRRRKASAPRPASPNFCSKHSHGSWVLLGVRSATRMPVPCISMFLCDGQSYTREKRAMMYRPGNILHENCGATGMIRRSPLYFDSSQTCIKSSLFRKNASEHQV